MHQARLLETAELCTHDQIELSDIQLRNLRTSKLVESDLGNPHMHFLSTRQVLNIGVIIVVIVVVAVVVVVVAEWPSPL
jgi:hypothetical protein